MWGCFGLTIAGGRRQAPPSDIWPRSRQRVGLTYVPSPSVHTSYSVDLGGVPEAIAKGLGGGRMASL